jgi:hypothetical protein
MMTTENALTTPHSPWWAKLLDRFGIPTAMLGVVLYFIWISVGWVAEKVVLPIAENHVKFLDSVDQNTQRQTEILQRIAEITEANQVIVKRMLETVVANQKIMMDTNKMLPLEAAKAAQKVIDSINVKDDEK